MDNGNVYFGKKDIADAAAAVRDRWLSVLPDVNGVTCAGKYDESRNLFSVSVYPKIVKQPRNIKYAKDLWPY